VHLSGENKYSIIEHSRHPSSDSDGSQSNTYWSSFIPWLSYFQQIQFHYIDGRIMMPNKDAFLNINHTNKIDKIYFCHSELESP
jgi:hypothetical protein